MFDLGLRPNLYMVSYKVKGVDKAYDVTFPDKREADKFVFDYSYHRRIGMITDMVVKIV